MASGGRETVDSLQATYKAIQQIAKALRVTEKDAQLRSFYAGRMAYCTIIYRHLNRVSGITPNINKGLVAQLVDCTESIFTPNLLRHPASARLRLLHQVRDKVQALDDNDLKLEAVLPHLDFRPTPNQRDAFLESLTALDEELETRYPEDASQWAPEDYAPRINIKEPSYAVWSAAKSIIAALTGCKKCVCSPAHDFGARICLGTHRKPDVEMDEDEVDFDMFLSMAEGWHEARIHTAKDRTVRLVVEQEDQPRTRQRQRAPKPKAVKQLCEPIGRIGTMAAYRLEFKVTKDRLFKLQSARSDSLVDKTKDPVSLDQFLRGRTGTFTERTRRILAVILSSAVFHLHNTPWLQPTWNSSGVFFFQTTSSAVTLRPFIQMRFSDLECRHCEDSDALDETESDVDPDDWDLDDIDPDDLLPHPCPILLTLAVMLLEVYFVTPFDTLAKRYKVDLAPGQGCTKYLDVDVVFKACRREIPENSQFYLAVENCLNPELWETEQGEMLSSQTLRTMIYEKIVLPLETELIQAYSSISIHDLDRFAQTLDFASWDQTIQAPNPQANSKSSKQNAHIAVGCGLSPGSEMSLQSSVSDQLHLGASLNRATSGLSHRPIPSRSSTQSPVFPLDAILSDSTASLGLETYPHGRYTVGILCALPKELLSIRALFDRKHNRPKNISGDINNYALGSMAGHMVVAACLPDGEYGTNAAADSASNMKRTFLGIRFCLLVGIGGGAPTEEHDIRLGDVVVSLPTGSFPGVIQYDRGKEVGNSKFELTGALQPPPRQLMTAISSLRSNPDLPCNPLQPFLDDIVDRVPDSCKIKYAHPGQDNDRFLTPGHIQRRPRPTTHPEIHYGLIASGNRVLKDAAVRDQWARKYGILCFEMEAAGVMNTFPCLVIRGICDYADEYKRKEWQEYAAGAAAAFAKLLLREVATCEEG